MIIQTSIPLYIMIAASASAFLLAAFALSSQRPGMVSIGWLLGNAAALSAASAFSLAVPDLALKTIAAKIAVIGYAGFPALWLAFCLWYTRRYDWQRAAGLLLIIPLLEILLAWTNEFHHLYWSSLSLRQFQGIWILEAEYGTVFRLFNMYTSAMYVIALTLAALHWQTVRGDSEDQPSGVLLLGGAVLPFLGISFPIFYPDWYLSPYSTISISALVFTLVGLLGLLALLWPLPDPDPALPFEKRSQ